MLSKVIPCDCVTEVPVLLLAVSSGWLLLLGFVQVLATWLSHKPSLLMTTDFFQANQRLSHFESPLE